MSLWATVIAASLASFAVKFLGHLAPARWFSHPRVARVIGLTPVALLAALLATQALTRTDGGLVWDARGWAMVAAAVALVLRAPFIVVLAVAAVTAALLRARGMA